ncbi:MAG TPA: universal stress protein [Terriglobales bacterium]|nr:universal stress protein [Terriglobales bacterium]
MKTIEAGTRIEIKNVLFATDLSPAAAAATPYAAAITKRFGANLYALHVRPPIINPMTDPSSWPALEQVARMEEGIEKETLRKAFGAIEPKVIIEEGDFWSALASATEKNNIDLIVMGTHGRTGIGKALLGSIAEEVFRTASCPVLTVGPEATTSPKYGEFTQILYATDFSAESLAAAPYAISLAQEFQANLTLLHVIGEPKTGELVRSEELTDSALSRLRGMMPEGAALWCVPQFAVENGPIADRILEVAKRRKADLIVLGVRRPAGFPGAATHLPITTAHKVVTHAGCPVLTVRG